MQAKNFNPQIFLEFTCCTAFGVLMLYLVGSGKYLSYVTPRMQPYLYFAAIVMLIWAFAGLRRIFRPQHKKRVAHCFVLVIPILLLLLPHAPISYSDLSVGYVSGISTDFGDKKAIPAQSGDNYLKTTPSAAPTNGDTSATTNLSPSAETSIAADNTAASSAGEASYTQTDLSGSTNASILSGLYAKNKTITVKDEEFYPWLNEIFTNMEKYDGYQISIKGFVFREPENMSADEFVSARLMMSCCVADLVPCGIICKYNNASELQLDTWITISGTIHIGQYMGQDQPQITVTQISPAEEVEGYIYPNNY